MAKSFKCDLTGELVDGEAARSHLIQLSDDFRLQVFLQRKQNQSNQYDGADMGPTALKKISEAVQKLKLVKPAATTET